MEEYQAFLARTYLVQVPLLGTWSKILNLKGKMKPLGTEEWEKGIEWEAEGKPNRFYVLIVFLEHKAGFPLASY